MAHVRAKVSTVVKDQVPEFIRDQNANFTQFLEAYYEWLETEFFPQNALEDIRDVDSTVDLFIEQFERELLHPLPDAILADKRLLMKHIKELYQTKGTSKSFDFLFRILFNAEPEVYFPKVDMLRVSDGKWDQRKVMRVSALTGDPANLEGEIIEQVLRFNDGSETRAEARVESIIQFAVGDTEVFELVISDDSLKGVPFLSENTERTYTITSTTATGEEIECNVISILAKVAVDNGGTYYSIGDLVNIDSDTGIEGRAEVSELGTGSVDKVIIAQPGTGYVVGDEIVFDNTNTGGPANAASVGARARITEVDRDSVLMEDGSYLLQENLSQFDSEEADSGAIKKITVLYPGQFYNKLPLVSLPSGDGRSGGKVLVTSQSIGRITKIIIPDSGIDYLTPPLVIPPLYMVLKNPTGAFDGGEILSVQPQSLMLEQNLDNTEFGLVYEDATLNEIGDPIGGLPILREKQQVAAGTVANIDLDRHIIELNQPNTFEAIQLEDGSGSLLDEDRDIFVQEASGFFSVRNKVISSINGSEATIVSVNEPSLSASVGPIIESIGGFTNADGKVSESSKKIQDSFYYQDYSYVIKVGESINFYRDAVKKFLHPIGLALFGEVKIQSLIETKMQEVNVERSGLKGYMLQYVIQKLIDARVKAVGRYRTNREEINTAQKLQTTLFITDFLDNHLNIPVSTSEFLPVLKFPHLTPLEISLLDLRIDIQLSDRTMVWEKKVLDKARYASSYKEIEKQSNSPFNGTVRRAGPNLIDLERWKFSHRPTLGGTKQSATAAAFTTPEYIKNVAAYPVPNFEYWNDFANTQIKDFGNISVSDVLNNPYRKVNYAIESEVGIIKKPASALRFSTDDFRFTWDDTFTMDADSVEFDGTAYTYDNANLTFDLFT